MAKKIKAKARPRKHKRRMGEMSPNLQTVEFSVRMYRGDAVMLAEFLKRLEIEWFSLRCLKEPLQKAGIKPRGGWL